MKYFIAVDGGGTKTKFVLLNSKLEKINEVVTTSSNPNDVGFENLLKLLKDNINILLPNDASSFDISLGISGLISSGIKDNLQEELQKINRVCNVYLYSDIQIALDANYPHSDGAIAIIGTGNVIYIRKDNELIQIGGAGYMFDHSLSGYDLGEQIISRAYFNYQSKCEYDVVTKTLIKEHGSMQNIIKESYIQGKKYVASFAKYAIENIDSSDIALESIKACVSNFEKYIKLASKYTNELTLVGGLAKFWDDVFVKYITPETLSLVEIKVSKIDPITGNYINFKL